MLIAAVRPHRAGWLEIVVPALLYCLVFAALRLTLSSTIGVDDVEQIILTQDLRWGYLPKQPPLHSWLLLGATALVGPGLAALVLVKYLLLFCTVVCYHRAASLLVHGRWTPLLATGSLALFYMTGFQIHIGFTHSATVMLATSLSLWLLLELCRRPSLLLYTLFGASLGLGLLAKYTFIGAPAAMLVAVALDPTRRGILRDRRLLAAVAAALVVCLPHAVWLGAHLGEVSDQYARFQDSAVASSPLVKRLKALVALAGAAASFLLPFIILVPLLYRPAFRHGGWRQTWRVSAELRFLATMIGTGLLLLLAMALGNGARLADRYMLPYLLFTPVLVLAFLEARVQTGHLLPVLARQGQRRHAVAILVLIAVVAIAFPLSALRKPPACGHCRLQKPYAALAAQLAPPGPGTLIAGDEFIGGNLRARLGLRTYSLAYPRYKPQPAPQRSGTCLIVWDAQAGEAMPVELRSFAEGIRGTAMPDGSMVQTFSAPYLTKASVSHYWHATVLPAAGDCR